MQGYLTKESAGQWLLVFDNADDINMWIGEAGSEPGSSHLITRNSVRENSIFVLVGKEVSFC